MANLPLNKLISHHKQLVYRSRNLSYQRPKCVFPHIQLPVAIVRKTNSATGPLSFAFNTADVCDRRKSTPRSPSLVLPLPKAIFRVPQNHTLITHVALEVSSHRSLIYTFSGGSWLEAIAVGGLLGWRLLLLG